MKVTTQLVRFNLPTVHDRFLIEDDKTEELIQESDVSKIEVDLAKVWARKCQPISINLV